MKHFKLTFVKQDDRWYIDLPEWTGDHEDLEMVAGADRLCEYFAQGKDKITVDVVATNVFKRKGDIVLQKLFEEYGGCTYDILDDPTGILCLWICDVTQYVLGEFPKYISIKHAKEGR
jgi:hypothetical protein